MERLWHLIPLFVSGFLMSRIMARTPLADRLVGCFVNMARGRLDLILLGVMASAATLSLFIPNMLTVLILLPGLEKLRKEIAENGGNPRTTATPTALALIYGANIGGMGSLVGSPANALLLGALEIYRVPARESVGFLSWFLWGIPLVTGFLLTAWLVLVNLVLPREQRRRRLPLMIKGQEGISRHELWGRRLGLATAAFWIAQSTLSSLLPAPGRAWDWLGVLFGAAFIIGVFFIPVQGEGGKRRPLLLPSDTVTGLPLRGIGLAVLAVAASGLMVALKADVRAAAQVRLLLPDQPLAFPFYLAFILVSIFTTEILSNTAASLALFPLAHSLSTAVGLHPLPAMMGVALASTCAFMSPLATPVNGLAFGGIRGVSLLRMLGIGLVVNLLGALWLTLFLTGVIPLVFRISLRI